MNILAVIFIVVAIVALFIAYVHHRNCNQLSSQTEAMLTALAIPVSTCATGVLQHAVAASLGSGAVAVGRGLGSGAVAVGRGLGSAGRAIRSGAKNLAKVLSDAAQRIPDFKLRQRLLSLASRASELATQSYVAIDESLTSMREGLAMLTRDCTKFFDDNDDYTDGDTYARMTQICAAKTKLSNLASKVRDRISQVRKRVLRTTDDVAGQLRDAATVASGALAERARAAADILSRLNPRTSMRRLRSTLREVAESVRDFSEKFDCDDLDDDDKDIFETTYCIAVRKLENAREQVRRLFESTESTESSGGNTYVFPTPESRDEREKLFICKGNPACLTKLENIHQERRDIETDLRKTGGRTSVGTGKVEIYEKLQAINSDLRKLRKEFSEVAQVAENDDNDENDENDENDDNDDNDDDARDVVLTPKSLREAVYKMSKEEERTNSEKEAGLEARSGEWATDVTLGMLAELLNLRIFVYTETYSREVAGKTTSSPEMWIEISSRNPTKTIFLTGNDLHFETLIPKASVSDTEAIDAVAKATASRSIDDIRSARALFKSIRTAADGDCAYHAIIQALDERQLDEEDDDPPPGVFDDSRNQQRRSDDEVPVYVSAAQATSASNKALEAIIALWKAQCPKIPRSDCGSGVSAESCAWNKKSSRCDVDARRITRALMATPARARF